MKTKRTYIGVLFLSFFMLINFAYSQSDYDDEEQGCKTVVEKKVQKKYDKAIKARKKGQREQAVMLYKEVIEMDPDFPPPYYQLGMNLYREIDRNPDNMNSRDAMHYINTLSEKVRACRGYFESLINICPEYNVNVFYYLASLYEHSGDHKKAFEFYDKLLDNEDIVRNKDMVESAKSRKKYMNLYIESENNQVSFQPKIVEGVSSKLDEYVFSLSPDQETMYYTRVVPAEQNRADFLGSSNPNKEMFTYSYFDETRQKFSSGEAMPMPFNQSQNEGGATITVDNKYMVFVRCFRMMDGYQNCDLYYSEFESGYWSGIKSLGPEINNPDTWETMPSISPDGKTLYFVSDRPGGYGDYDIYVTNRNEDGSWGKPENVGPTINTKGKERTPFIHSDSQTLYFSSDGHVGFGGSDIFYSRLDSNNKWSKPVNLGYPINTDRDESGFFVSIDGTKGYYASNINLQSNRMSDWNLYEFDLPEKYRPQKVVLIKGDVKNEDGEIVEASVSLRNTATKRVTEIPIDMSDGKYATIALLENDYILTVKKENHAYETKYIDASYQKTKPVQKIDFEIKPIDVGKSYELSDIYFKTDSYELNKESKFVIDAFIEFMNDHLSVKVELQGHTDNIGSAQYNQTLSENRAKAVFDYIVESGVSKSRLSYKGYGQSSPIATNSTEEGRAKNRRTVFMIISK
ncbi:MAG: OmpA family protein [Bacteroidales bacterium]|nr:OmpA family protein [Bacteroidales bacterium]